MELTKENKSSYKPHQAIVVYKKQSDYYLESHSANEIGKSITWSEGVPFKKESLKNLAVEISDKSFKPLETKGVLPTNLLYFKQSFFELRMVWFIPPMLHKLHFTKELKIKNGFVHLPGLIFVVENQELSIFAVKTKERPDLNTRLFKAPFHNIHDDGDVCLGNTISGKQTGFIETEMERWESMFFNSEFSHFLDKEVVSKEYNLSLLFKELVEGKRKLFPMDALVECEYKNIEDLFKKIKK
jgi:PRTRC genetic system protein B